jgi:hypothetical protein
MENIWVEEKYLIVYVNKVKKCSTGSKNKENCFAKEVEKMIIVI